MNITAQSISQQSTNRPLVELVVNLGGEQFQKMISLGDEDRVTPANMSASELGLTQKELEVLQLVDHADKIIAIRLKISACTVKEHFKNIRFKTGLNNKIEMAAWAAKKGLI